MAFNNSVNANQSGMQYLSSGGVWSAPTLTQHAPIIGDAANEIKSTAAMTNGQVLIGSTGVDPVPATITAGSGISISNGAGSITISSSGGITWNTTSVNVANMAVDNGYFCVSPGGALTLGLPAVSVLGDTIRVSLAGATSWQITQAVGQQIKIGSSSTTSGGGGSLTSTAQGDSIELVCLTANTIWYAQSIVGNITVV